jgi:hypothetical protein
MKQILAEKSVLSAPVYDKATNSFVGFFDYQDLVAYVSTFFILHHSEDVWRSVSWNECD